MGDIARVAAIRSAREAEKPIGMCGQAPLDKPGLRLVRAGITSISLNRILVFLTRNIIAEAEPEDASKEESKPLLKGAGR